MVSSGSGGAMSGGAAGGVLSAVAVFKYRSVA